MKRRIAQLLYPGNKKNVYGHDKVREALIVNIGDTTEELRQLIAATVKNKKYRSLILGLTRDEFELFITILRDNIFSSQYSDMRYILKANAGDFSTVYLLESNRRLVKSGLVEITRNLRDIRPSSRFKIRDKILKDITGTDLLIPENRDKLSHEDDRRKGPDLLTEIEEEIDIENDLILSKKIKEKILSGLTVFNNLDMIKEQWGESDIISDLKRVAMLFYGPPGTGKTMTAKAIASYLGVPLYLVNIQNTISMWYGQSEKLIKAVFEQFGKKEEGILLFDEADSIFGKRISGASRTVDATHNRVINIVLQEMEKINKMVILTTNFKVNFDEAFERRIAMKVEFDRPGIDERRAMWKKALEIDIPMAKEVSADALTKFELSGGEIQVVLKNAIRQAALRISAGRGCKLSMDDFRTAVDSEFTAGKNKQVGFAVEDR